MVMEATVSEDRTWKSEIADAGSTGSADLHWNLSEIQVADLSAECMAACKLLSSEEKEVDPKTQQG